MRSKLSLNLDELTVDSFDTIAPQKARGTVFGEQCTCQTICTCPGCPTCDASCNGTCDASCNGTCDPSCAATCLYTCDDVSCLGGNTCGYTCDDYCAVSRKYTNCNDVCY